MAATGVMVGAASAQPTTTDVQQQQAAALEAAILESAARAQQGSIPLPSPPPPLQIAAVSPEAAAAGPPLLQTAAGNSSASGNSSNSNSSATNTSAAGPALGSISLGVSWAEIFASGVPDRCIASGARLLGSCSREIAQAQRYFNASLDPIAPQNYTQLLSSRGITMEEVIGYLSTNLEVVTNG